MNMQAGEERRGERRHPTLGCQRHGCQVSGEVEQLREVLTEGLGQNVQEGRFPIGCFCCAQLRDGTNESMLVAQQTFRNVIRVTAARYLSQEVDLKAGGPVALGLAVVQVVPHREYKLWTTTWLNRR